MDAKHLAPNHEEMLQKEAIVIKTVYVRTCLQNLCTFRVFQVITGTHTRASVSSLFVFLALIKTIRMLQRVEKKREENASPSLLLITRPDT